jgi:hypothetical protein
MKYITLGTLQTIASAADGILVQINLTLSGTITLATAVGGVFAIITDPQVGQQYRYNGLRGLGALTIEPSGATNVTVSFLNRQV